MLYNLKIQGKKYAFDTACGALVPLSALQYKMLSAIIFPLTPICPTSLRYELAKYDSGDVSDAYGELYSFKEKGLLDGGETKGLVWQTDGEFGCGEQATATEILKTILPDLGNDITLQVTGSKQNEIRNLIQTMALQYGKTVK